MDRKRRRKRRRRRNTGRVNYLKILCLIIVCGIIGGGAWYLAENTGDPIARYEAAQYNTNIYQGKLFADSLCVASEEVSLDGFDTEGNTLNAAGLFNLKDQKVVCGYNLYEKVYPASTTKLMTAYLALKYGNPEDVVTLN